MQRPRVVTTFFMSTCCVYPSCALPEADAREGGLHPIVLSLADPTRISQGLLTHTPKVGKALESSEFNGMGGSRALGRSVCVAWPPLGRRHHPRQ